MKSVVYLTCTKLPCIGTSQAPVILCIKDTIELISGNNTLPAVLVTSQEIFDDCSGCVAYWRYTIGYDETLLVAPEVLLVPADIVGIFCKTCFTDWIESFSGGLPVVSFTTMDVPDGTNPVATSVTDTLTFVAGANITITGDELTNEITFVVTGLPTASFTTIDCPSGTDPVAGSAADTLTLAAGANITITGDAPTDTVTVAVTGLPTASFTTIDCPAGTDPVADSASDTLTFIAGSGITITGDATTDTITIAATGGGGTSDVETLYVNVTEVLTSGTVFTDLMSYTIPANTLAAVGDRLEIFASVERNGSGLFDIEVLLDGNTIVFDTIAVGACTGPGPWKLYMKIYRLSAASIRIDINRETFDLASCAIQTNNVFQYFDDALDLTAAKIFKIRAKTDNATFPHKQGIMTVDLYRAP